MATPKIFDSGDNVAITWTGETGTGGVANVAQWPSLTVQATGTGTVTIEGSVDGTTFKQLKTPQGANISLTASAGTLVQILENVNLIRPVVTGGTATVSILGTSEVVNSVPKPKTTFTGPKVAIFGTSITFQNTYNAVPPEANPARSWYVGGYATWARILTDQRINLDIADNYGVSGDTFAQMLARIDAVIAANADYVFVEGGTNDISLNVAYDSMVATWTEIVTRLKNSGAVVVVIPMPTRASALTATQLATQMRFYNFQRQYTFENEGFLFADYMGSWVDQTSATAAPLAGRVRPDNVHPDTIGAYYMGKAIADVLNPLLPPKPVNFQTQADIYNATTNPTGQLLLSGSTNLGLLAGTGGTQQANAGLTYAGTGFAAGSFFQRTAATSTATVTLDKENPRTDAGRLSGERQIVQISAAAGGGADEVYSILYTLTLGNTAPGDWYYAECGIEITGAPVNVNSIELFLQESRNPGTTQFSRDLGWFSAGVSALLPSVTWKGVLRTAPLLRQADATAIQLYIRARLNATAGASVTYKISDITVRKIDPQFV